MEAWVGGEMVREREREREKEDSREDEEKRLRRTTTTTTTAYNRALLSLALRRVVAGHTAASN